METFYVVVCLFICQNTYFFNSFSRYPIYVHLVISLVVLQRSDIEFSYIYSSFISFH